MSHPKDILARLATLPWSAILEPHGWTCTLHVGRRSEWTKNVPGEKPKDPAIALGDGADGCITFLTPNGVRWDKFEAWCICNGHMPADATYPAFKTWYEGQGLPQPPADEPKFLINPAVTQRIGDLIDWLVKPAPETIKGSIAFNDGAFQVHHSWTKTSDNKLRCSLYVRALTPAGTAIDVKQLRPAWEKVASHLDLWLKGTAPLTRPVEHLEVTGRLDGYEAFWRVRAPEVDPA